MPLVECVFNGLLLKLSAIVVMVIRRTVFAYGYKSLTLPLKSLSGFVDCRRQHPGHRRRKITFASIHLNESRYGCIDLKIICLLSDAIQCLSISLI
jgi:hypothetical protein